MNRLAIYKRDDFRCGYCGTRVRHIPWAEQKGKPRPPEASSVDHRIPKCRGGTNAPDNLVTCCDGCNTAKGRMTDVEFLAARPASANQKKLADAAITALARWEMAATPGGSDDEYRFTAND